MPKVQINKPLENILLVWDRIGDYHAARFLELEKTVGTGNIFISDLGKADSIYKWNNPLFDNPHYLPLSDQPIEKRAFLTRIQTFISIVKKEEIKIVGLAGYGRIEYLLILVLSKFLRFKVILFAESWYGDNKFINKVKELFLKTFCKGFLVSGQKAKDHFSKKLGIPDHKIEIGYSVVDNQHFGSKIEVEKENILLCVARFSKEKNLILLIKAFKTSTLSKTWTLKIVGGGPLKQTLQHEIGDHPRIQLSDWLSYSALPFLYAHARFFILPSTFEPWGLVANEAMAAGLPISLSTQCGCVPDLLSESSGFTFDGEKETEITSVLNKIATLDKTEMESLGAKNKGKVDAYSTRVWAKNFLSLAFS